MNEPKCVMVLVPLPEELANEILPRLPEQDRGAFLRFLVEVGYKYFTTHRESILAACKKSNSKPGP